MSESLYTKVRFNRHQRKGLNVAKERGVFERPKGSGVFWINYYKDGKQHREKAGNKSSASALYKIRKAAILKGEKLPDLVKGKPTLSALIDDVLEYTSNHKSARDYVTKAGIIRKELGASIAANITPQDIDRWLTKHCKTPATRNRYRAFLSLVYREANRNGKVDVNPARSVRQRPEGAGRLRYLSDEEYKQLHDVVTAKFPAHLPELIVSLQTGMRLTEQYTLTWGQIHFDRKAIELTKTKNGSARTVYMNAEVVEALKGLKGQQLKSDPVFPRLGTEGRFDTRSWFVPCLAAAKIQGYVWHSNRHTFCSRLAMAGATIKEIQVAAGHKTITMSARYSHLSPNHQQSVLERITTAAYKH